MRKKSFTQRFMALGLGILLSVSLLAACSNDAPNNTTASNTQAGTDEGTDSGDSGVVAKGEELPIVAEKTTYTAMVIQTSALKQAKDKKPVIAAEEATNIAFEWSEIPSSGWTERVNILFNTDSIPDLILGDANVASNYEQLLQLDDYLEDYAPNTVKFLEARPEYRAAMRAADGTIRSLPTGDEAIPNSVDAKMWINVEWLENVGLEMPTTTEEFEAVLYAFKNDDPNGNGEADEIPLTFRNIWGWAQGGETFFGPFGVIENSAHLFVTEDNEVKFSPQEDGYKDALRWFNKLYADGVLDSEAFVMSSDEYAVRDGGRDIVGTLAGYNPSEVGVNNGENNDRYQALPALVGPNGHQMVGFNSIIRSDGYSISRNAENPEALVRWYDYVNSTPELKLQWGRGQEGEFWQWVEDEDGNQAPMWIENTPDEWQALGYTSRAEYRNGESFSGQTPALWDATIDNSRVINPEAPIDYGSLAIEQWQPYAVYGLPAGTAEVENTERRAILLADIDNYLLRFISDSVMNGLTDEQWDAHISTLADLNVEEYLTLAQEYTDSVTGN